MSLPLCQNPECTIHHICSDCQNNVTFPKWGSGWYNRSVPKDSQVVMKNLHQRDWPDLQFSATFQKSTSDDYHAYFRLHEMSAGRGGLEAEEDHFVEAQVKWDGCSNWWFVRPNEGLHFCDKSEFVTLSEAMSRCWDWASELIPNWNG